jgi:hypothetical protein
MNAIDIGSAVPFLLAENAHPGEGQLGALAAPRS